MFSLEDFVEESNRIEGMHYVKAVEVEAHRELLAVKNLRLEDMQRFVTAVQPGAILRDKQGLNVRVGTYYPPEGGPKIKTALCELLDKANAIRNNHFEYDTDWGIHVSYEKLHPFTDGNGRSSRALWLWMNHGHAPIGFLHQFYYETLQMMGNV